MRLSTSRLPTCRSARNVRLVQEYMAHHQGMILVALDNYLSALPLGQDGLMVQRFHSDPRLQSVDLLLQDRVPADVPLEFPQPGDLAPTRRSAPPVDRLAVGGAGRRRAYATRPLPFEWALQPADYCQRRRRESLGRFGLDPLARRYHT